MATGSISLAVTTPRKPSNLLVPWTGSTLCAFCCDILCSGAEASCAVKMLKISAARGCGLCRFLYEELVVTSLPTSTSDSKLEFRNENGCIEIVDQNHRRHRYEIYSIDTNNETSGTDLDLSYRQIHSHPHVQACWDLINSWISDCTTKHVVCRQDPVVPKPTRLIEISTGGLLRLVKGSDCADHERYAILSYCWGARQFMMLTRQSLTLFENGIDAHCLPRSLQDALYATKRLGLRFLWIDALCVLQDDKDEWEVELPNIGMYYRNAFCTISALSARDTHEGLLRERNQKASTALCDGRYLRAARPKWSEVFQDATLSKRAWALQERLLSTRLIHFESDELFWECSTCSAREGESMKTSMLLRRDSWTDDTFKRALTFGRCSAEDFSKTTDKEFALQQWDRIICLYSSLGLTYAEDRFPAIAGIAEKIHEATGYTYISGLWKESLHAGLLWHVDNFSTPRKEKCHAPSWSWAASGSPIRMIYDWDSKPVPTTLEAEVLDFRDLFERNERYTRCREARLLLNAYTAQVWYRSASNGCAPYSDPYLQMMVEIFNEKGIFIGTGYLDELPEGNLTRCTAIVISQRKKDSSKASPITYFLLTRQDAEFDSRIGIGQTYDKIHDRVSTGMEWELCKKKEFLLR